MTAPGTGADGAALSAHAAALRALIFDVDGTLAETERDGHRIAFNRAFAETGLDWHWDTAEYGRLLAITGGRERMLHYWRQRDPDTANAPAAASLLRDLHARKNAHYAALVGAGAVGLRAGVVELLQDALVAGLRLAIATTTSRENVDILLCSALPDPAIRRGFEVIVAGEDVAVKKPHSEVYTRALSALGLAAGSCLAFEDSRNGLLAAMGADLPTVIVRAEYTRCDTFSGALAVFDGFTGFADAAASAPWCDGPLSVPSLERWHREYHWRSRVSASLPAGSFTD